MNLQGITYKFNTYHYNVGHKVEEHPETKQLVEELSKEFMSQISQPIGTINCDLDTRFEIIRRYESAACNLICDIVRKAYEVDIVIIGGGGIRSDKIHKQGQVTYKDILDLVPFQDPVMVKRISGKNIIAAIKHSIRNLPKLEGRFVHVSGLKYVYDSSRDPMDRLLSVKVNIYNDEEKAQGNYVEIDEAKQYTVASREYTMGGGDGFESLKDENNEIIVDNENGVPLSVLLRNFFWTIETFNDTIKLAQNSNSNDTDSDDQIITDLKKLIKRLAVDDYVDQDEKDDHDEDEVMKPLVVEPQIEGRIIDKANQSPQKFALSPRYNKLPPYKHMRQKPQGRRSIFEFLSQSPQKK